MKFAITATVRWHEPEGERNWTCTRQIPTFFLYGNVQWLRTEADAERVAREIINPLGNLDLEVNICAVAI